MRTKRSKRRVWALAVGGVLLATGCSSPGPLPGAQQEIESLLEEQPYPVNRIHLSDDTLSVVLVKNNELSRWELYPEKHDWGPVALSAPGILPNDVPVGSILGQAERLFDDCSDDTREVLATTVSSSAVMTTLDCGGEVVDVHLNGRVMPVLEEEWTQDTLTTIWEELLELAPDGQYRSVALLEGTVVAKMEPVPGPNADCVIQWTRRLSQSAESGSTCLDARPNLGLIDVTKISAEDVYRAIRAARVKVHLPDGAPTRDIVIDADGEGRASFYLYHAGTSVTEVIG